MMIRILHLDGDSGFCASVQSLLASEGAEIRIIRAQSEREFRAALDAGDCDLILSEFSLSGYEGPEALKLARLRLPQIPFIFLSAAQGEEAVAGSLRLGADDFVAKSDLHRLAPTVERAL